ncbi:putative glutathione S-transferase [Capsicum chinense]|nr:putative glutathione S-transferase [Capsicum chinense]
MNIQYTSKIALREALWSKFEGEQEKIKHEAYEMLKIVDNELKGKKFFGRNKIGFVDVAANYIPFWVEIIEAATGNVLITREKFPNLCAWIDESEILGLWYSPYSNRVEWALKLKGVEYEFIEQDLQNKSPLLLESNPIHKKIPVLIHNGKPICESMVIVEYIDETFEGPPILPKDPYDRAIAHFWAKFFAEKGPAVGRSFLLKGEEKEKAKEEVYEMLKVLDNELKDKKFFVGDKFGFADITANASALWLGVLEEASGVVLVTSEMLPNFCAWRDQYINYSENKKYLPLRDELLAKLKARVQPAAAPK